MTISSKLTNRQILAINQIIASPTLEEARVRAKISKGTLYAWLKDGPFKAELKRQRDEVIQEALNCLKGGLARAVDELLTLLASQNPNLRYRACRDVIEYALKSIELEEIDERLSKVEAALAKR